MEKIKMTKPMVKIHDQETNEIIEREMTDAEFADYSATLAEVEAEQTAKLAAKQSVQEKLETLGLTPDDLKALGL